MLWTVGNFLRQSLQKCGLMETKRLRGSSDGLDHLTVGRPWAHSDLAVSHLKAFESVRVDGFTKIRVRDSKMLNSKSFMLGVDDDVRATPPIFFFFLHLLWLCKRRCHSHLWQDDNLHTCLPSVLVAPPLHLSIPYSLNTCQSVTKHRLLSFVRCSVITT